MYEDACFRVIEISKLLENSSFGRCIDIVN
jgi:hypothetical protein